MSIVSFPVVSTVTHESQEIQLIKPVNNYTLQANQLTEAVCQLDISGRQHRVLQAIIRKTISFDVATAWISASKIAEAMKYDGATTHINADIRELKKRNILISDGRKIGINPNISEWVYLKQINRKQSAKRPKSVTFKNSLQLTENGQVCDRNRSEKVTEIGHHKINKQTKPIKNITPLNPPKGQTNKKSKPAKPKREKPNAIDLSNLPDSISEDSAKAFIEHRKAIKAPLTQRAFDLAIAEALKGPEIGITPEQALDETMLAGWKGVKIGWLQRRLCTLQRGGQQPQGVTEEQTDWVNDLGDF